MPKGERGTSRPYERGQIWWIRYTVPGEDAVKLLNQRRTEIDSRTIVSAGATIGNLLDLYLDDKRRTKGYRERGDLCTAAPPASLWQGVG